MGGVSLVVHGHFYQPPRENPWVGIVERQDSARPFHDWNERIAAECYTPNAFARILDDAGRIVRIVNNYEFLSFNFGPTLLEWLEAHAADTYQRILDADRRSLAVRGHGNAIAQAYNHAILPLCSHRDRLTQIRWGTLDFERRFGRRPEAMWIPETAIDAATVEALIDEGLRFVVLSPHQAESVRHDTEDRFDVSTGSIDPTRPYRIIAPGGRHLDAFFYDGPSSHAVGFEGVLASSRSLVDRLARAIGEDVPHDRLIPVATDGESYGHHTRHGERTLAYALAVELPARGFRLTNFAAYLAAHPPVAEVTLKAGPDGEGTAWSCAHGLGRWLRDCGCSAGHPGWHQRWRAPLRAALDRLRDRAASLFERRGEELLRDPWAARDAYPAARGREPEIHRFLDAHAARPLGLNDRLTALHLLEMQRYVNLMYTSCGWFFDELSGLEATQVLRYARRVIELCEQISGEDLEPAFLELLAEAPSNLAEYGDGAGVYRELVVPTRIGPERLAAQEAIMALFIQRPREVRIGDHQLRRFAERRAGDTRFRLVTGRMSCRWIPTGEVEELAYVVLHVGGADVCCAVRALSGAVDHRKAVEAVWSTWPGQAVAPLLRAIERGFGPADHTVRELLPEERERVLERVYGDLLEGVSGEYARLYDNHRHTMHVLRDAGLPIPEPLRQAAETVLGSRFEAEVARQRRSRDPSRYRRALQMVEEAREGGLRLDPPGARRLFGEMLSDLILSIAREHSEARLSETIDLLALGDRLGIDAVSPRAQELLYQLILDAPELAPRLRPLCSRLGFGELSLRPEADPEVAAQPEAQPEALA